METKQHFFLDTSQHMQLSAVAPLRYKCMQQTCKGYNVEMLVSAALLRWITKLSQFHEYMNK